MEERGVALPWEPAPALHCAAWRYTAKSMSSGSCSAGPGLWHMATSFCHHSSSVMPRSCLCPAALAWVQWLSQRQIPVPAENQAFWDTTKSTPKILLSPIPASTKSHPMETPHSLSSPTFGGHGKAKERSTVSNYHFSAGQGERRGSTEQFHSFLQAQVCSFCSWCSQTQPKKKPYSLPKQRFADNDNTFRQCTPGAQPCSPAALPRSTHCCKSMTAYINAVQAWRAHAASREPVCWENRALCSWKAAVPLWSLVVVSFNTWKWSHTLISLRRGDF